MSLEGYRNTEINENDYKEKLKGIEGAENNEEGQKGGSEKNGGSEIQITETISDIKKLSENTNDNPTKNNINSIIGDLESFKTGFLSKEEKIQYLSLINKVKGLLGTEHAENAQAGKEAQKSAKNTETQYNQKLEIAIEELRKFIKENSNQQNEIANYDKNKGELADLDLNRALDSEQLTPVGPSEYQKVL